LEIDLGIGDATGGEHGHFQHVLGGKHAAFA